MKKLTINNVEHCYYEIDGEIVYLKIIPNKISKGAEKAGNNGSYEYFLVKRIGILEKVKISKMAYLNI